MSWVHSFILSNMFIEKIIHYVKMKYSNDFKNINTCINVLANKGVLETRTEEVHPFSVTLERAPYTSLVCQSSC